MKRSGDLLIGRSGDRKGEFTAETRRLREIRKNSDFSDQPITCDHPITRSHSAPAVFKKMILILRAALREIFDESAYDRFLLRTNTARSIASYRAFSSERDSAMLKKPRCC